MHPTKYQVSDINRMINLTTFGIQTIDQTPKNLPIVVIDTLKFLLVSFASFPKWRELQPPLKFTTYL